MEEIMYGYEWNKKTDINPAISGATVVTGKMPCSIARIIKPFWVLDYEFSGMGDYRIRTESALWRVRQPWTVHLYPPHKAFWEDTRRGMRQRNSTWMHFSDSRRDLRRLLPSGGYGRFLDREEKIGRLIRRAAETGKQRGERGFWDAQAALCEALDLLMNARLIEDGIYEITGETDRSGMSFFAENADAFMKDHLTEHVTLPDIADHLHVSVSSLAHRYRQATGASPKAALAKLRIGQAKALLAKGYPLKAIAGQLGFADAFHLSKTFKRLEGVSPREFIGNQRGTTT